MARKSADARKEITGIPGIAKISIRFANFSLGISCVEINKTERPVRILSQDFSYSNHFVTPSLSRLIIPLSLETFDPSRQSLLPFRANS
jgi:hypothetical protein